MLFWLKLIANAVPVLMMLGLILAVIRSPYEVRIARRYLYGGRRDRTMLWF